MQIRAFVIDDDAEIRSILASLLEIRGYEVVTFPSAVVCRRCPCLAGQVCADIVISDVSMPRLTGVQFVEQQIMKR